MNEVFKNKIKIRGEFTYDYNILHTHNIICEYLKKESLLCKWIEIKKELHNNIENEINVVKKNILINRYKTHIKNKPDNINIYNEYLKRVINIIEEYKELSPLKKMTLFEIGIDIDFNRIQIIQKFLYVAKFYIDIEIKHNKLIVYNTCPNCENKIEDDNCKICSFIKKTEDISDKCDGIKNYEKNILCFQGKQKNNIPDSVLNTIEKYLIKTNGSTRQKILHLNVDKKGHKQNTSLEIMEFILKKNNLSHYFVDIYLICKLYWGWELLDLSYMHEYLLNNFNEIKVKLPIPYRLFKEIEMYNFFSDEKKNIERTYFRLTKSNEKIIQYDNTWEKALKNYIDTNIKNNEEEKNKNIKFIKTI